MRWIRNRLAEEADHALERAIESPFGPLTRYNNTFSTLTIHFAPGSEPQALSIPYQPFGNRQDIHVPFKVVQVDE